jgi:hypothetical protein
MSLYREFSTLLPYIQSVRKLKEFLSFDISFPSTWKLPKKFVREDRVVEQESKIPNERMISFVSEISEEDVETTYKNIQSIIKYNLDREEKERLFNDKVNELKSLFEKQNLTNLKGLEFQIKQNQIQLEDDEEQLEQNASMVRERIVEGQE